VAEEVAHAENMADVVNSKAVLIYCMGIVGLRVVVRNEFYALHTDTRCMKTVK